MSNSNDDEDTPTLFSQTANWTPRILFKPRKTSASATAAAAGTAKQIDDVESDDGIDIVSYLKEPSLVEKLVYAQEHKYPQGCSFRFEGYYGLDDASNLVEDLRESALRGGTKLSTGASKKNMTSGDKSDICCSITLECVSHRLSRGKDHSNLNGKEPNSNNPEQADSTKKKKSCKKRKSRSLSRPTSVDYLCPFRIILYCGKDQLWYLRAAGGFRNVKLESQHKGHLPYFGDKKNLSLNHIPKNEIASSSSSTPAAVGKEILSNFLSIKNKDEWSRVETWANFTNLTITQSKNGTNYVEIPSDSSSMQKEEITNEPSQRKSRLIEDGYVFVGEPNQNNNGNCDEHCCIDTTYEQLVQSLATVITKMHKEFSFPPTFILLFDETWKLAQAVNEHNFSSSSIHEKNVCNYDMLAWYIDPKEDMAGFSPHRDRQPKTNQELKNSFHEDGQAKYVTNWLALTDATPENSCLYVIPRKNDPGYYGGDDEDDEDSLFQPRDPLSRALSTKESYQNIRALPCQAGHSVLFTHRILHWGSRGNPSNESSKPRIAISFVASDPSFEQPYLKNWRQYTNTDSSCESNRIPSFQTRLLLVCAQLLIYYQRFDLPKESLRACYEYCKEFSIELDEAYWKKVSVEFVKAMREDQNNDQKDGKENGSHDEEDEEAVLDAMIDNASHSDINDDFDELDEDGPIVENTGEEEDDDEEEEEAHFGSLFGGQAEKHEVKRQRKC